MKLLLRAALLLAAVSPSARAQRTDAAAIKLLVAVSAHYRDADYLHLEATTSNVTHSPRRDGSYTGVFSLRVAPGERFHYIGEDASGSGELVSDGTTEWRLMNSFHEYAEAPSGSFYRSRALYASDNSALLEARNLRQTFSALDGGIRSAHFGKDEMLHEDGKSVLCAVVWFTQDDSTSRATPDSKWRKTVWIDAASLRVLKMETRSRGHIYFGSVLPPNGPAMDSVQTVTVTRSDFHFEPKPDSFVFVPPDGATKVASLPTGLTSPLPPVNGSDKPAGYLGKPLPSVSLKDADGGEVPLARYRGHPLLIDVWATWCGPCLSAMPAMNRIRTSTTGTDLQMIAVDEDLHSSDARSFLEKRGYEWKDYAYTREFVKALDIHGIPLVVLADAEGRIVYYHSGAEDAKGLAEAIAKLGPDYTRVKAEP